MELSTADLAARYGKDHSTICRWRREGLLPAPVSVVACKNYQWAAEDIERWEKLGQPGTTDQVEANLAALVNDLELVAEREDVHPALRKLAAAGAQCLTSGADIKVRLALGGTLKVFDWSKYQDDDGVEALKDLQPMLRILEIVHAKN